MSVRNDVTWLAFWGPGVAPATHGVSSGTCGCRIASSLLLLLLPSACATGPDFVRPEAPSVVRYTNDGPPAASMNAEGKEQYFVASREITADWWRLFNSPAVDQAMQLALAANPTLQSAQATLRQSQDNLRAGEGVFYPQIEVPFSAARQRVSPLRLGVNGPGNLFNLFTINGIVTYALDLFGGQQRTVEGLAAQSDVARNTMRATWLTLSGNIVNTMIARAAYMMQITAVQRVIDRQQQQLVIAQARARAGTAPYFTVLNIQSQLATNQAALPGLQQKRDQADHLLAKLLGHTPGEANPPAIDWASLSLPAELPLSLPSALVRQRPDILAAEAQLHAASAAIGVATAALYPTVSLSGNYGGNGTTIGTMTAQNNRFWSAGPVIDVPVFQGGTSWYRRGAAIEAYRKGLADYRQTVLDAFVQVADTLKALEHDAQGVQARLVAMRAAEQEFALVDANYRAGIAGYLDLLAADVQLNQSNVDYLQASAQRYQDTVALFVALGGGWWDGGSAAGHSAETGSLAGDRQP